MIKYLISFVLAFALSATCILSAQDKRIVELNLKTGYSVKGEIVEQSAQGVKIKTLNGEIFEYQADEITSTSDAQKSGSQSNLFSPTKVVPQIIAKGDKLLGIGIGLINQLPNASYAKMSIPPIPVSFEYIVKDDLLQGNGSFGVGAFIGYSAANQKNEYWKYKSSRLIIGARGYLHYALIEKLDTYAGVLVGYKSDVTSNTYSKDLEYIEDNKLVETTPALNIFAGCRYFFDEKIAGMAELGWGISIITVGITVKL